MVRGSDYTTTRRFPIVVPPAQPPKTEPLAISLTILRELAFHFDQHRAFDGTVPRSNVEQAARQINEALECGRPLILTDW